MRSLDISIPDDVYGFFVKNEDGTLSISLVEGSYGSVLITLSTEQVSKLKELLNDK